jgi:hypothetical protein
MQCGEILAAVVAQVEGMLAKGFKHATIAAHLGLTQYVVDVIANDDEPRDKPVRPQRSVRRRVPNMKPGIDATTIRMVHRMLAVGILRHVEIAREAGVSPNTVSDVACGKRKALTLARPHLDTGERFVSEPMRCGHCHAMISVMPCRACRATCGKNRSSAGRCVPPTFHGWST